jgi:hypothetical protein
MVIDEALSRSERNEEKWYVPELLRTKGELRRGGDDALAETIKHLQLSIEWSRRQETLSWELRTAISLARLHSQDKQANASRNLLGAVYDKFREGQTSADLVAARRILDEAAKDQRRA